LLAEVGKGRDGDGELVADAVAVEDDGVGRLREDLSAEMCDHESGCIGLECAKLPAVVCDAASAMICDAASAVIGDVRLVDDAAKLLGEDAGVAGGETGGGERIADDELERARAHDVAVDRQKLVGADECDWDERDL